MEGLELDYPQTVGLELPSGTGYLWLHQITPPMCASIEELNVREASDRVMPGFKKSALYTLN